VCEKSFGVSLKPSSLDGIGVGPERSQRGLRSTTLGEYVFVQIPAENAPELGKR